MKKLPAIPITLLMLFTMSTGVHADFKAPGDAAQTITPGSAGAPEVVPPATATSPDTSIKPNSSPGVNPNSDIDVRSSDVSAPPAQGS